MRFVLLFRNDPVAASSMLAGGREGIDFLATTIGQFGGRLEPDDIVPVMGRFDAVAICDFPSYADALGFTLSAAASGQQVEALPAATGAELDAARDVARRVAAAQSDGATAEDPPAGTG